MEDNINGELVDCENSSECNNCEVESVNSMEKRSEDMTKNEAVDLTNSQEPSDEPITKNNKKQSLDNINSELVDCENSSECNNCEVESVNSMEERSEDRTKNKTVDLTNSQEPSDEPNTMNNKKRSLEDGEDDEGEWTDRKNSRSPTVSLDANKQEKHIYEDLSRSRTVPLDANKPEGRIYANLCSVLSKTYIESWTMLLLIGGGIFVIDSILFGVGCWCLSYVDVPRSTTLEREYMRANVCIDIDLPKLYCTAFKPSVYPFLNKCECDFGISVKQDIKGAVTLYYELEDFNQSNISYASSKDDMQLMGTPGDRPAESCGNYSYNGNLPIFPCGEIADSIFNDTFTLKDDAEKEVPVEYTDLVKEDTMRFRNLPEKYEKNFADPINWGRLLNGKRSWEAEPPKGIENPAFRAWMDISLKRKPVWRVQRKGNYSDGLPAGNYTLAIMMHYGVDRYEGPRKIILEGVYSEAVRRSLGWGIALVLLGIIVLLLGAGYIFTQRKKFSSTENEEGKPSNDDSESLQELQL